MIEVIHGDCLKVLVTLPDCSVNCVVTSPPYWGLRDYGVEGQLGLEPTPEAYVANLVAVFREVKRVLRPDGVAWLNLGDSYAATCRSAGASMKSTLATRPTAAKTTAQREQGTWHTELAGLKPKDLVGIPWRVAFALQADGWWLRQDIIWHKPNPMPESVTDRCTKSHEYIFLMSKSPKYYYDAEAIKEPLATEPHAPGNKCGTDEGHLRNDFGTDAMKRVWGLNGKRNKRSVWTVSTKPFKEAHFATFPPDLIRPCVLAGCPRQVCSVCGAPWERVVEKTKSFESGSGKSGNPIVGKQDLTASDTNSTPDIRKGPCISSQTIGWQPTCSCNAETIPGTVLDPFNGAGTTGVVTAQEGRNFIGIELNQEYVEMARARIEHAQAQPKLML